MLVRLIGAGGGGGSGAKGASTFTGGGGGAPGAIVEKWFTTTSLVSSEVFAYPEEGDPYVDYIAYPYIQLGAGGTGAAGVASGITTATNGLSGTKGGDTIFKMGDAVNTFSTLLSAVGGNPGMGGSSSGTTAQGGTSALNCCVIGKDVFSNFPGANSATVASIGTNIIGIPVPGSGGGNSSSTPGVRIDAISGGNNFYDGTTFTGARGGAFSSNTTGDNGSNGCGGGGGGSRNNASGTITGAGGTGGNGKATIITFL